MKIGVFDSGIGGISVAKAIEAAFPQYKIIFKDDSKNLPYGTKTVEQIYACCKPILDSLVDEGCDVIVVACNTVSTNLISRLREEIDIPLIALEPMVKPASEITESKVIVVCATPRTLASDRYSWLKNEYASDIKVIEPDCSDWTAMIEAGTIDQNKITTVINEACDAGADVIVLGCTHYHWIEDMINRISAGRAKVIQPEQAVIKQLKVVLGL